MRSPWKIQFVDPRIERLSFSTPPPKHLSPSRKRAIAHTYLRGASIPNSALNKRVAVHTGHYFVSFIVSRFMLGRRFGEFIVTKKLGRKIHMTKKKKKKVRKL